ncbi:MAG: hypothetical protein AAFY08_14060 [Planctomycetota bacterium]
MTTDAPNNPTPPERAPEGVPSRPRLVDEALARFEVLGIRSRLLGLDSATLRDLGLRLVTPPRNVAAVHRWLNAELGVSDEAVAEGREAGEGGVDDNALHRFDAHFRKTYEQVRREHARRVARLTVEHATDGNIRSMTRVAQLRLVELTAEKLVEAENFDDLGKAVNAAMFAVKFAQDRDLAVADFERKQRETSAKLELAEKRTAKLEAEVARLNQDIEERQRRLDAAVTQAKAQVAEEGEETGIVDADTVIEILDRVMKGQAA